MSSAACLACGCGDFIPNPFKPDYCITCQHNHKRKAKHPVPQTESTGTPSAPAVNRDAKKKATATASKPKAKATSTGPAISGEVPKSKKKSSSSGGGGFFAKMKKAVGEAMKADDEVEHVPVITGPTGFKRGAHIGISESGTFETANVPPDLAQLLADINSKLAEVGETQMTNAEAAQLLANVGAVKALGVKTTVRHTPPSTPVPPPPPPQSL
jgi:hypothetical protein